MLDTTTRRRIDTARDILVGKVPDPKSQVEQITIALIYKFMDDIDAESEEFGGERSFFANEFTYDRSERLGDAFEYLLSVLGFQGYDISPDMVRLSLVNMYLHGFAAPHIFEYDTLTSQDRWNDYADVILANPPFMSPKGGVRPHNRFSVQSKRSEVLFVDYIVEHLNPGGRAAVIVPEGIHFVAQKHYRGLRRMLLEDDYLLADISLPHGVFKPYASVKTHILILDRPRARRSNDVLFIEIENDGFTQSDTRLPIDGSELAASLICVRAFKESIDTQKNSQLPDTGVRSYTVSKATLLATKEAHLLGRWYDLPNRIIHRPNTPLVRLGDLCDIRDGLSPNMGTLPGHYPMVVPAENRKTADHFDFDGPAVCVPLVSSAGHGKAEIKRLHYQNGKFALASTMSALFVKDTKIVLPRYLFIFLSAMSSELLVPLMCGATNVTMNSGRIANVLIPVPTIAIQSDIIESALIRQNASILHKAAMSLKESSNDVAALNLAEIVLENTKACLSAIEGKVTIDKFLSE